MKNIAILDIGSNSVRLVLVKINKSTYSYSFKIFDELKETIRLGEDLDESGKLKPKKIDKAIHTLKMLKNLCEKLKIDEIIPVATAAVRKATNQQEFLNRVENEVDLKIRVLSGQEEAFYAYYGVINSMDITDGLIMDIGGGSTELIQVKDRQIINSISLPFGAITLTQSFNIKGVLNDNEVKNMNDFFYKTFQEIPWLNSQTHTQLIGVGGTFRNIGKIHRHQTEYPLEITHNYQLKNNDIHQIYNLVRSKKPNQRRKIKGLSKSRADIFPGAMAAISTLVEFCNLTNISISGSGIREGLIYNYLLSNTSEDVKKPVDNVLDFSISNIISKSNFDQRHPEHVYKLTQTLFNQLKNLHHIEKDVDSIIKTASMLHDIGIDIRFYNHHEHSFYMILNSGINGLSHKNLLLSAMIAASHRKNKFKINLSKYKNLIDKEDIDRIQKLGVLLRLAESLDRSRTGIIKDIQRNITDITVEIQLISLEKPELEFNYALAVKNDFEEVFSKELIITY